MRKYDAATQDGRCKKSEPKAQQAVKNNKMGEADEKDERYVRVRVEDCRLEDLDVRRELAKWGDSREETELRFGSSRGKAEERFGKKARAEQQIEQMDRFEQIDKLEREDKRYRQTEMKIQEAIERLNLLIKPLNELDVREFCDEADVSRASFYRHYRTIDEAIARYRERLKRDFEEFAKNYIKPDGKMEGALELNFYLIFCYLKKWKKYFRKPFEVLRFDDTGPMLAEMRRICLRRWISETPEMPESCQDQLFFLFKFEFLKEIAYWFRFEGCDAKHENYHVERLCYLVRYLPRKHYPMTGSESGVEA